MPEWFHKGPSPFQTPLAMIGAKTGNRVLVIGASDPDLAAQLALVTGLNGVTLVVDSAGEAEARVEAAAREAGALVIFEPTLTTTPPREADGFDLAVIVRLASQASAERSGLVREGLRTVRRGGRVIVVEGARRSGWFGALREKPSALPAVEVLALLQQAGGKATRLLAEADGVTYYETRKG